jgi:hypothetical protein
VAAAPISALVRVSRRLAVPSACVGLLSFLQVSDHVASVYPSTLPRRATVTIEDTRVLREMLR